MKARIRIPARIVATALVAGCISLVPVVSSAFVPEDLAQLKSTNKCPGCDLRAADLRGMELADANLEGANLMGANLTGVTLTDATLEDASLEKANFSKANLKGASLDHATIDDAVFTGADLQDMTWTDGKVCGRGSIGVCKK